MAWKCECRKVGKTAQAVEYRWNLVCPAFD
jgi:hypothetical protein